MDYLPDAIEVTLEVMVDVAHDRRGWRGVLIVLLTLVLIITGVALVVMFH